LLTLARQAGIDAPAAVEQRVRDAVQLRAVSQDELEAHAARCPSAVAPSVPAAPPPPTVSPPGWLPEHPTCAAPTVATPTAMTRIAPVVEYPKTMPLGSSPWGRCESKARAIARHRRRRVFAVLAAGVTEFRKRVFDFRKCAQLGASNEPVM
jgi:hypothetical protein